jgi:hypothetical protein
VTAPPGTDAAGNTIRYDAAQTIDGLPDTGWRVPGDGVGQSVTLTFDEPVLLEQVQLIPGYAKVDPVSGVDRFQQNRRITRVRVEMLNGANIEASLEDSPELQTIDVPPTTTQFVRVVILESTEPGTVDGGRDFAAISEFQAQGVACTPDVCDAIADDIRSLLAAQRGDPGAMAIEAIADGYARLAMVGAMSFWRQEGDTWALVTGGSIVTPDALRRQGIPESVWP